MPLHPPGRRRERILTYGGSGSGKSSAWLNVAKWLQQTGAPGKVRLLDTDFAWEAYRPTDGSLDERVVVQDAWDWADFKPGMEKLTRAKDVTNDDWLVVDLIDKAWSKAQQGFFEYLTDRPFDEFMGEAVKNNVNVGGEWGSNWGVINKMYGGFMDYVMRWRGHVLCCAPMTEVRVPDRMGKGGDTQEIRDLFGRVGFKPQGQKDLPHMFHTVLFMQAAGTAAKPEWRVQSIKDRERPLLKGDRVDQFVMTYLMKVAGWKP